MAPRRSDQTPFKGNAAPKDLESYDNITGTNPPVQQATPSLRRSSRLGNTPGELFALPTSTISRPKRKHSENSLNELFSKPSVDKKRLAKATLSWTAFPSPSQTLTPTPRRSTRLAASARPLQHVRRKVVDCTGSAFGIIDSKLPTINMDTQIQFLHKL
ncbi:hypothetical protein BGZ63DRAFT_407729 [Mariannaea sp. PMI_226]|nr:hypothetical protein BGZ63DRAFT_407729 [Mariannaea sp. PMI_226]